MFQGMEYVYEVYLEKSFSKAAEKLFISQPSLSANVKRVEHHIGYPIFDRSTKPLSLTECGVQYIKAVEKIKSIQNEFEGFANDWGDLKKGTLTLGGSNLFSSWILPPLIADFARRYPLIQISLIEETTANLARMLRHGQLDLMLDSEPFIMLKPENDTGKRARMICRNNLFEPNIILEMDQQMTSYNITCSGMGISFIGDIMLSKVPLTSDVVYYKLPAGESSRDIRFYWKNGRYQTRAMEEFLKMACQ